MGKYTTTAQVTKSIDASTPKIRNRFQVCRELHITVQQLNVLLEKQHTHHTLTYI